jgi:hypothetical protein
MRKIYWRRNLLKLVMKETAVNENLLPEALPSFQVSIPQQ